MFLPAGKRQHVDVVRIISDVKLESLLRLHSGCARPHGHSLPKRRMHAKDIPQCAISDGHLLCMHRLFMLLGIHSRRWKWRVLKSCVLALGDWRGSYAVRVGTASYVDDIAIHETPLLELVKLGSSLTKSACDDDEN